MHLCGGQHLSSFTIQSYITKFPVDDIETVTVYVTTGMAEVLIIMALNSLASFCHQYHVYSSVILFLDLLHSWVLYAISFTDTCTCICFLMHSVKSGSTSVDLACILKVALEEHLLRPNWILMSSLNYHCYYYYHYFITIVLIIILIIIIIIIWTVIQTKVPRLSKINKIYCNHQSSKKTQKKKQERQVGPKWVMLCVWSDQIIYT